MRKIFSWLIKCVISIGILYYLFLKIPFNQVITALISTKIVYLLPAILLQIGSIYISAAQMKVFVSQQKMDFTVPKLMQINFITFFYRLFLPGELSAGVVRWHKLSRPGGMRAQALACIVLARATNILTLAIIGIVFFLIEMPYNYNYVSVSLVVGLLFSFLLFLSIINAHISSKIEYFASKLNFSKIPNLVREKVIKVWNSIKEFHKIPLNSLRYGVFLSVLFHSLQISSIYFFMQAVDINISIISITWITAAVFFLQMLPISISGLGVREYTFVFLLKKYGVYASDAMALSLLIFGVSIAFAFLGAIFEAIEFFKQGKEKI